MLQSFLSRQIFLWLSFSLLLITSYTSHALTAKTSNPIHGNAPYLTFDGGQTRVTNTEALLGISLSDGRQFTPTLTTSNSRDNPIVLPVAGQSFADIGMFIPTDTDSIELSSLIGPPNNYWGDDDGDGQGRDGIRASGTLSLSIVDKNDNAVARSDVPTICNAPYKVTLTSTNGTLNTLYGIPNNSDFSGSSVSYYINPKDSPRVCFAKPILVYGNYSEGHDFGGSPDIWNEYKGFIVQSTDPSSYNLNFPTIGANNLYFDLDIGGARSLTWEGIEQGKITTIITPTPGDSTGTSFRVTLKGPSATKEQWGSNEPNNIKVIPKAELPKSFELVGRNINGDVVVKYGFQLKQWVVNRGTNEYNYSSISSWCGNIGYRLPKVKDLTNASCRGRSKYPLSNCQDAEGAMPASPDNYYQRRIGAGFFSEWGYVYLYPEANFHDRYYYWTSDTNRTDSRFIIDSHRGDIHIQQNHSTFGLCVWP
ncbi:hypothetical protein [Gilliamella apis]|uniref:hypothetical protein n=1 Tax=Gilliamella apis TaxID=1970738 RepID=UPI0010551938|nr:hypothetical protein [Gilliamella apis]